jgi:thiamine-phosphate diphosphorylase
MRPIISAITDRHVFGDADETACDRLVTAVQLIAAAGADLIQVRERGLHDRQLVAIVRRVVDRTGGTGARVIVNERTDIALAAGAHGVHLPAAAPAAGRVRRIVPEGFVIGRSVHDEAEAEAASAAGGCDYLTFGTVFPSRSKPADHPVAGLDRLAVVCARVSLPVLAIGGISVARAVSVARAGASGIAAIGLFADPILSAPPDRLAPVQAALERIVKDLRHAFESAGRAES